MEVLGKILGELLMIIVVLLTIVICVGIKVECPQCHSRFYHQKKICPDCGYEYGTPLPDQEDETDELIDLSDPSDQED